jgi:hypothetical protein
LVRYESPGCGKCKASQRGKRPHSGFLHDRGSVILDGALTDSEIRSYILAGVTGENHLHDLALPTGEASQVIGGVFAPFRELS